MKLIVRSSKLVEKGQRLDCKRILPFHDNRACLLALLVGVWPTVEPGVSPHLEPALIDALIVHGQHMLSSVFGIKQGPTKIKTSRKTRRRPPYLDGALLSI